MFLVHVHTDIFSADHTGRSFLEEFETSIQTLLQKERPFILRRAGQLPACAPADEAYIPIVSSKIGD
jgi:hypothetical protein